MSILKSCFDKSVNQASPVQDDFVRVVNVDDVGNEIVTYSLVDYSAFQSSLGFVRDWSLDSLIKAGVSPDFPIHTGMPTRIEGVSAVAQAAAYADSLLSEVPSDVSNE